MIKIKKTAEHEKKELEKAVQYSLKNADRPLDEKEQEAENNAVKFSLRGYPRIPPIPGTLGFALRNFQGGNASVIEYFRYSLEGEGTNRSKWIKNFIILWNSMDEFSRRRVDIFDILCRKYDIPQRRFWGVLQEGVYDFSDQLAKTALSGYKVEFIELLKKFANDRRNFQDRKLLAQATGLVDKDGPLVAINDNSTNTTVTNTQINNGLPSFSESIRVSEKSIRESTIKIEPKKEPLQLEEGQTDDFIEAILVEAEREEDEKFEHVFRKLSKGI